MRIISLVVHTKTSSQALFNIHSAIASGNRERGCKLKPRPLSGIAGRGARATSIAGDFTQYSSNVIYKEVINETGFFVSTKPGNTVNFSGILRDLESSMGESELYKGHFHIGFVWNID